MTPLRIVIGFDPREAVAYHVLSHSILARASRPVAITPLVRAHVAGTFTRPRAAGESTDFSVSRFLTPFIAGYRGMVLYLDCDMLVLSDLAELFDLASPLGAVSCVQHDYTPSTTVKFLGQAQTAYPRKNWSSVMLFNAGLCRRLTPEYVNAAPAADLHRFAWLDPRQQLGALPLAWNWLVGEYEANPAAKLLHYTLGGPWFPETRACDHAKDWLAERAAMLGEGEGSA